MNIAGFDEEVLKTMLSKYWGSASLKPYQKDIIDCLLNKRDCFAMIPPSHEKSILYQIPCMMLRSCGVEVVSVIISPLLSRIEDERNKLLKIGIVSLHLDSNVISLEDMNRYLTGEFPFLFLTPERAMVLEKEFRFLVKSKKLFCLVVDEAHFISYHRQDYRSSYGQLYRLREWCQGTPILALSSCSTTLMQSSITSFLSMHRPFCVRASINRSNIKYSVIKNGNYNDVVSLVLRLRRKFRVSVDNPQAIFPTIVFVTSRKDADQLYDTFNRSEYVKKEKLLVRVYHSGMSADDRLCNQNLFMKDEAEIIIATSSFGALRKDIRLVIHFGLPSTLVHYVEQSSLAGQDNNPSLSILMFSKMDFLRLSSSTIQSNSLSMAYSSCNDSSFMTNYAKNNSCCRRKLLLDYYEETWTLEPTSSCCDICDSMIRNPSASNQQQNNVVDMGKEVFLLLYTIEATGGYGIQKTLWILMGSYGSSSRPLEEGFLSLPSFGMGISHEIEWWKLLLSQLIEKEMLIAIQYRRNKKNILYEQYLLTPRGQLFLSQRDKNLQHSLSRDIFGSGYHYELCPQAEFATYLVAHSSKNSTVQGNLTSQKSINNWHFSLDSKTDNCGSVLIDEREARRDKCYDSDERIGEMNGKLNSEMNSERIGEMNDEMNDEMSGEMTDEMNNDMHCRAFCDTVSSSTANMTSTTSIDSKSNPNMWLSTHLQELEAKLREVRSQLAKKYSLSPYLILSSNQLRLMIEKRPQTLDCWRSISTSSSKFDEVFIDAISQFATIHNLSSTTLSNSDITNTGDSQQCMYTENPFLVQNESKLCSSMSKLPYGSNGGMKLGLYLPCYSTSCSNNTMTMKGLPSSSSSSSSSSLSLSLCSRNNSGMSSNVLNDPSNEVASSADNQLEETNDNAMDMEETLCNSNNEGPKCQKRILMAPLESLLGNRPRKTLRLQKKDIQRRNTTG